MSTFHSFIRKICIQRVRQLDDFVKLFEDVWVLVTKLQKENIVNAVVSLEDAVLVVREVFSIGPDVPPRVGTAFEENGDDRPPVTRWTYMKGGFIQEFAMRPAAVRVGVDRGEMHNVMRYREEWQRGEPWWLEPV
ncbi:hypothetical protein K439DRAFT_1622358 [Ramaria rubella]|nr:hypothetical protein K439DRAFT_1622358 [Ramaria rubella]